MNDAPEAPPSVVEAIRDGVVVVGGDDRVRSVNAAVECAMGVDRGAVVGASLERLLSAGEVAPREAAELHRAIEKLRDGGDPTEIELTYTDGEGRERVGIVRLTALGGGPAVAAIVRDVTERRDHERILASLHGVTRRLVRADDPREICAIAVHAGGDLLDLPISGVWLVDDDHGRLEPVAGTAGAHDEFGGLPRFAPGEGLVWDAFEAGELQLYGDLREVDGLYNPETRLRSEIIAPIGAHGVLMTGSFEAHAFDEADRDLLATLVENARAALDRADRDQLLRERADRIASQADRLETVAGALSTDVDRELEAIEAALAGTDGEPQVGERIDRIRELVADVGAVAGEATGVGRRERVELGAALETAVAESRADPDRIVVENGGSLRAAPGRLRSLLASVLNGALERAGGSEGIRAVRVGTVDGDERGFYVAADGEDGGTERRTWGADGLDLAVARAIADAHGWRLSVGEGRVSVRGVATLEP
ncbi:GAF domain-containing protein [Saliphagus sp. LR7]|uniref:GAF domain-containing protein n=1 Tax=Saliphagus sp. LR7 TaxID=2282654 RepID=UPI000DF74A68|nr:GAF domain-containing protein [Saliphagus sp. LR7]